MQYSISKLKTRTNFDRIQPNRLSIKKNDVPVRVFETNVKIISNDKLFTTYFNRIIHLEIIQKQFF